MGAQKQDWTIWVRNPHPFPDEVEFGRSSINEAIAEVFQKIVIEYGTPYNEYHVVTVRHATRSMTERIAQTIQTMHMQRMHETKYYPVHGWCSVEIREGTDEQAIPGWAMILDEARIHQRPMDLDKTNSQAPCFVPALPNSVGTPITQEIVGYLFKDQKVMCHRCVFSDMGLLEYTSRRDELVEQAIWDTDEQLFTLFCSQCHHPLIAIVKGHRQSLPYKDVATFVQHNGVCYIPPLVSHPNLVRRYRHEDFLSLAQGNEMLAASLFARCTHEIPEHVLPQLEEGSRCP